MENNLNFNISYNNNMTITSNLKGYNQISSELNTLTNETADIGDMFKKLEAIQQKKKLETIKQTRTASSTTTTVTHTVAKKAPHKKRKPINY